MKASEHLSFFNELFYLKIPSIKSDKFLNEIEFQISEAKLRDMKGIYVSQENFSLDAVEPLISKLLKEKLKIVLQISTAALKKIDFGKNLTLFKNNDIYLNLIILKVTRNELKSIEKLESVGVNVFYTLAVTRSLAYQNLIRLRDLNQVIGRSFLFFPLKRHFFDSKYTARQAVLMMEKLNRICSGQQILPFPRVDFLIDQKQQEDRLHHSEEIVYQKAVESKGIKISVIIPSYNNAAYLEYTLKHLFMQDFASAEFEIIVVDDGSNDQSLDCVKNLITKLNVFINLKYLYLKRDKPREMGDNSYRAGIARNIGARHAKGEILLFIDSDVLVSRDFLKRRVEFHEKGDKYQTIIQASRIDLNQGFSKSDPSYSKVTEKDLRISDAFDFRYWDEFNKRIGPKWAEEKHPWKYTCSHSLSIKKEHFKSTGWFRENYVCYGFEDTDLGFRAHLKRFQFLLDQTPVFHLFHEDMRSEFKNSEYERHKVLSRSGLIFFHNNLSNEIFEALHWLISHDPYQSKGKLKILLVMLFVLLVLVFSPLLILSRLRIINSETPQIMFRIRSALYFVNFAFLRWLPRTIP